MFNKRISFRKIITHTIHVWYIHLHTHLHLVDFYGKYIGNYISPMDPSWAMDQPVFLLPMTLLFHRCRSRNSIRWARNWRHKVISTGLMLGAAKIFGTIKMGFGSLTEIWMFPKIGGFYPQIIYFNRVFHDFHHPFWGTPIFGNIHISCMVHTPHVRETPAPPKEK